MIDSLAWPTVVLVFLGVFRKEIAKIVQRLGHLKYKDLELDFGKVNQQAKELNIKTHHKPQRLKDALFVSLEDQILEAAEKAPSASILLAWSGLEATIAQAVARKAISPESPSYRSPLHNIEQLVKYAGLSKNYASLLNEMRMLRNKLAHPKGEYIDISQEQALNYANTSLVLMEHIEGLSNAG